MGNILGAGLRGFRGLGYGFGDNAMLQYGFLQGGLRQGWAEIWVEILRGVCVGGAISCWMHAVGWICCTA
jgi:hypothetical protein